MGQKATEIIDKRKLTTIIYKRLNKTLTKSSIYDALTIINNSLIEMVLDDKSISIDNFGTISSYLFHGHKGFNIGSGEIYDVKPFKTIKFRAHNTLSELLVNKKSRFRNKQIT